MAWFSGDAPQREPTMQEMLGAFMATITQANVDANTRGAINAQRTTDMMQFMMQQSQQMHAQMAQGLQSMAENQGSGGSGDTASHGYRALKPKKDMTRITAESARILMNEISSFEVDLNELGIAKLSEPAYRQLRAMAEGKAKDVIDIETVQGRGKELFDQLTWATNNHQHRYARDDIGGKLYNFLVSRLEDSVRLNTTKRLTIAEEIYSEARMYDDTPKEAELFLSRWRRSRYMMHKEGLVNQKREVLVDRLSSQGIDAESIQEVNHSLEISERREMHTFLHQRVSKSVYEFIMSQSESEQARNIDDCIVLIQKYCEVKARVLDKDKVAIKVLEGNQKVVSLDGVPYAIDDPRISGVFQQMTEEVSPDGADEPDERWYFDPSINAFSRAGNASYGSTRGGKAGPKGAGKDREGSQPKGPPPGAVRCPTCHGYHEDLQTCPNGVAQQDPVYRPTAGAKCSHFVNGHKCDGQGHYTRHHRQQWMSENPGSVAPWMNKNSKGKGKGKRGRYNGKGISKRIFVLADGTWMNDDDLDPSLLETVNEEDYDYGGEAGEWEEPQVSSGCSPSVPPAASESVAPVGSTNVDVVPQTASMTAGQQRAAQWSAGGVAGGPATVKDSKCGSLTRLEVRPPSCSRLMRGEVENYPLGAGGVTKPESLPYVSIPCDYQECPEGYDTRGFVALKEPKATQDGVRTPAECAAVTVDPYALSLMFPNGYDSEGILLDQRDLEVPSSRHLVPLWPDGSEFALSDTIHAQSDRLSDDDLVLFNNSKPPQVAPSESTVVTPRDVLGLDANFVSSVPSSDQNTKILSDGYQINSICSSTVQACVDLCEPFGFSSCAENASVALFRELPAFRWLSNMHDGTNEGDGAEESQVTTADVAAPEAKVRPKARLQATSKARACTLPPMKLQIPPRRVPASVGNEASSSSARQTHTALPVSRSHPPVPIPKHVEPAPLDGIEPRVAVAIAGGIPAASRLSGSDQGSSTRRARSVPHRDTAALLARSEELKRRLTRKREQFANTLPASTLPPDAGGRERLSLAEDCAPTLTQCISDTEAVLDQWGADYVRRSRIDGGKTVPTPVRLPRAVLWVAGEAQVTAEFLKGCSDGVLVITAKQYVPDCVRRACEAVGVDPPLAFAVSHAPTHDSRIYEVLRSIFSALNSGRDVVIHCVAGKHRAASLALVVLMLGYRLRLPDAHGFLRGRRPIIDLPGLFRHAKCDPETGYALRPGERNHFLVEYDALVGSWSTRPPEPWFIANCQLYASEQEERNPSRTQLYCSAAGAGYRDVVMHSPDSPAHSATIPSAEGDDDHALKLIMEEALAPGDIGKRLTVRGSARLDPQTGLYISCEVCGKYWGEFIRCFQCRRWVHVECRPPGETSCINCYDEMREREEAAKKELRAKRFAIDHQPLQTLIVVAPASKRCPKRRKVAREAASGSAQTPSETVAGATPKHPSTARSEASPVDDEVCYQSRATILSQWLPPGSTMSRDARGRLRNMTPEEYDDWRVREAYRVGKRLIGILAADRDLRHRTHPRDSCYMELTELAERMVWGHAGGPYQAYGSLEPFARAVLRNVKFLPLPSCRGIPCAFVR